MSSTYEPIATTTLGSAQSSVIFGSGGVGGAIPGTYTDLRVVVQYTLANGSNNQMLMRFNSDTATNYSRTYMEGSGTSATSGRGSSEDSAFITYASSNTQITTSLIDVMNYSNATTYKTALSRLSNTTLTDARVHLWRKTPEAINTITFSVYLGSSFATGSTFTLYGIKSA